MNYDKSENSHLIPLELSEELKKEEIIQKFVKNNRINSLELSLNHKYKQKTLLFTIPAAKKMDWTNFVGKISRSLQKSNITLEHIIMIEDVINSNHEIILNVTEDAGPNSNNHKEFFVRKYTANGSLPLHESVVFADSGQSAFVYLDDDGKLKIISHVERPDKTLFPADSMDSQDPLPYTFASPEELQMHLDLAKRETLDSLYQQIKLELQRYLNMDEYYLVVIAADIIFSYFQDKFPTVHYDIFVGDNGSGKNAALLVISRLGYRVFYVVSASAANYFTFYGEVEECQGTFAEDEAGDLEREYEKQKILKSGYTSGGTVPKIDFVNGKRSQAPYNVYGMKWIAMEELPDTRKTRGIFDRSLVFKCIAGHVDYNIKDIIKNAGEPKFKPLQDKLIHLHKLLFARRLVHYNDTIPDIRLNIENRNAELTKPLLRLFCSENDASGAVEEIRFALSKFIAEKNELKSNSIESAMHATVTELINESLKSEENNRQKIYEFTNEQIWNKFTKVIDGMDIRAELLYSTEYGKVSQKRLTSLYKSKFRAVPYKTSGSDSKRGLRFSKEIVEKIGLQYQNEDEIKILKEDEPDRKAEDKSASDASDASHFSSANAISTSDPLPEQSIDDRTDIDSSRSELSVDNSNNLTGAAGTIASGNCCGGGATIHSGADDSISDDNYNYNYNYNSSNNSNNKQFTKLISDVTPTNAADSSQIKSYSKNAYTLVKSDASDASDASHISREAVKLSQNRKTKAEQAGKPELPCIYCDFKDPLEFDLSLHYLEKHRPNLIRLPIGKNSMDNRADYAVELSKKKLSESFDGNDDEDGYDELEIDEEEEEE
jgi:hypothetical protein